MARQVTSVLLKIGGDRLDRCLGSAHIGLLQWPLRLERLDLSGSGSNACIDLRNRGSVIIIDDFSQHLVGTNTVEILHGQSPDVTRDFGCDGGQVRLQIGIVGGLPLRVALPAIPTGRDDDQHGQRDQKNQRAPDEIAPQVCFEACYGESSRNLAIVAAVNWEGPAPKRAVT